MSKIFGQLERAQLENVAVDPSGGDLTPEGRVWWNTADDKIKASTGSVVKTVPFSGDIVNADIAAGANLARNKLASGNAHRLVVGDVSGVMTDASAITGGRALVSNGDGIPTHSSVTASEIEHVSGVTSAIQTQLNGKLGGTATAQSGDYTILNNDGIYLILMNTGVVDRTVTLPDVAANNGRVIGVKKVDSAVGNCNVTRAGSATIDGLTTWTLYSEYDEVLVQSDGTNWHILQKYRAKREVGVSVGIGQIARSLSAFDTTTSTSYVDVTDLTLTLVTNGGPVDVRFQSSSALGDIASYSTTTTFTESHFKVVRGVTDVHETELHLSDVAGPDCRIKIPPGALNFIDFPTAGTHTYKLQFKSGAATTSTQVLSVYMIAFEIGL